MKTKILTLIIVLFSSISFAQERYIDNYILPDNYQLFDYNGNEEKQLTQTVLENQFSAKAYFNRGCYYLFHDSKYKAGKDFEKSIELDANNPSAYFNLAQCQVNHNRDIEVLNKTLNYYKKAISLKPNFSKAYEGIARLYENFGYLIDNWPTLVKENYDKSLQCDPYNVYALFGKAEVEAKLQNQSLAIIYYTRAIDINPKNFDYYSGRADAKFSLGDYRGAILDYTKAIDIEEAKSFYVRSVISLSYVYKDRGLCYINLNDKNNACLDFSKSGELGNSFVYDKKSGQISKYCK